MTDLAHKQEWLKAAQAEIDGLESKQTWIEVDQSEATTKILPGTWVFRRKRTPDGEIKKFKARYCVRGDLQEGTFETYAPVVAWSTVRLFLVLSLTLDWYTCSIDFTNAFVQAEFSEPVWIHLPRGFRSSRPGLTCLRLKRSLYGLSIAPRLWYEHLFAALRDEGFVPSSIDPCLLLRKDMIIICYVDDGGIASVCKSNVDNLLRKLQERGFELTRDGSFSEYLGVKVTKNDEAGTITMTQQGLIQKILNATGMTDCHPNWTPAAQLALGTDPDG